MSFIIIITLKIIHTCQNFKKFTKVAYENAGIYNIPKGALSFFSSLSVKIVFGFIQDY